jgi:6,7-dimethyl-8-ribityllumazine synthase
MKTFEGHLSGKDLKFGIVISRFNELVTGRLLDGAKDALIRHGADDENIEVIWVPGAFEIPSAAQVAVQSDRYEAVICLSAVIRGDTPHFDYIAAETTKGIAAVGLQSKIPVTYGVITADTLEQALERAGSKAGNKGWDAAVSAIEMTDLFRKLKR